MALVRNDKLLNDHLSLLAEYHKLHYQYQLLQQEYQLNDYGYIKKFYDDATELKDITEPTPNLKEVMKEIPNMYKDYLVEYIEQIKKNILTAGMKATDNV